MPRRVPWVGDGPTHEDAVLDRRPPASSHARIPRNASGGPSTGSGATVNDDPLRVAVQSRSREG